MSTPLHHVNEGRSNSVRDHLTELEPKAQRTFTPTQAVIAHSAGVYHWTPEGRRLYDFSSGVLVSNLGHNPQRWTERLFRYLRWPTSGFGALNGQAVPAGYFAAAPLTAYNAVTDVEVEASRRLLSLLQSRPGGGRLEQVMWAASGSEAIQKALWAALARDHTRGMILA